MKKPRDEQLPLDWHVASRRAHGQRVSGDMHLVQPFKGGLLLAVVDGVGHGREATIAARTAVEMLKQHAQDSVISLVLRCHEALLKTRGVVMTVASLNTMEHTVSWIGVGNVEARLLRIRGSQIQSSENILLRGGMVGYQLPALHASVMPVARGDVLIFASDGIYPGFDAAIVLPEASRAMAEQILNRYFKGTDDAMVLVARYTGRNQARHGGRSNQTTKLKTQSNSNTYGKNSYLIGR